MIWIPIVLLAAYAGVCLLAFVFQSRLVFFPEGDLVGTPRDAGLAFREVFFEAEDGVRLHGWMVPGPPASAPSPSHRPLVLLFHGNAGNISHRVGILRLLHDLGVSVFIFDYRGYGRSEGTPSERGTYRDADAAWRLLTEREGYAPSDIVLFGRSLGSAVAVELASRRAPAGVILDGSFSSAVDVGRKAYPFLPVALLSRIRYNSVSRIAKVGCPKLFFHSPDDAVVPVVFARKLFDAASDPKEFVYVSGGHEGPEWETGTRYARALTAFIQSVRPHAPDAPTSPADD